MDLATGAMVTAGLSLVLLSFFAMSSKPSAGTKTTVTRMSTPDAPLGITWPLAESARA